MEKPTIEMVAELRKMQSQIIHGTDFFGKTADRLEYLTNILFRIEIACLGASWEEVRKAIYEAKVTCDKHGTHINPR